MPSGRPVLPASLDEDTDRKVREFCAEHGVTASGLVEALLRLVISGVWEAEVVRDARRIDGERRSRLR